MKSAIALSVLLYLQSGAFAEKVYYETETPCESSTSTSVEPTLVPPCESSTSTSAEPTYEPPSTSTSVEPTLVPPCESSTIATAEPTVYPSETPVYSSYETESVSVTYTGEPTGTDLYSSGKSNTIFGMLSLALIVLNI